MAAREMAATAASPQNAVGLGTYRRRRSSADGDESLLDEMLEELGIPDSGKKRKRALRSSSPIELLTPPRSLRRQVVIQRESDEETKGEDGVDDPEVVMLDLTTPTPPSAKRKSPRQPRESIVDLLSPDGPDPEPPLDPSSPPPRKCEEKEKDTAAHVGLSSNVTERSARRRRPLIQRLQEAERKTEEDDPPAAMYEGPVRSTPSFTWQDGGGNSQRNQDEEEKEEKEEEEEEEEDVTVWEGIDWEGPVLLTGGSSPLLEALSSAQENRRYDSSQRTERDALHQSSHREQSAHNTPHAVAKTGPAKQPRTKKPKPAKTPSRAVKQPVVANVAIASCLLQSDVGQAIQTALEGNVYNNKPVPFVLEQLPASCGDQSMIRWQRCGGDVGDDAVDEVDTSRYAIALHFPAELFLTLVLDQGYNALIQVVEKMRRSTLGCGNRNKKTVGWGTAVLIIEGMDRALIQRKKKTSKTKPKAKAGTTPQVPIQQASISFSDLHELAFRVFMDTSVHTKFTCDVEATASYVALLTREIVVAAVKQTTQEEFLESVPRVHSFRVLPSSGSTLNPFANAWLRMLQMIPGVSEDRAQSVLDHFPTLQCLLRAYNDPRRTTTDKEELLADKLHASRNESTLSRRIHRVFSGWNDAALV